MTGTSSLDEPGRVKLQLAVGRSVNAGTNSDHGGRRRRFLLPELDLLVEHIVGYGQRGHIGQSDLLDRLDDGSCVGRGGDA